MGKPLRVLVVEDSEDDTELILDQLREGGYEPVHERVETAEAMAAALQLGPWDVVISDHLMPRFDSLAALSVLNRSGLDLPFIIVSGVIGEDVAVEAMRAGVHDYLMKDRLVRLVPAVEREIEEARVRREKREAEEALRVLNQTLEKRVEERTAELSEANQELAAERAREHEQRELAEAAVRRLRALQYVAETVLSDLPLDELLGELLQRMREVLSVDTATILLLTEDGKKLEARASSGLEEEVQQRVQIPMGQGIAGRIAATGRPMIVDDLANVDVANPLLRQRVRSLLGAPLKTEGRLIGVIHVGTVARRHFTADDLLLMELVAGRAASAIERRRAEDERDRLLAELDAIFKSLADPVLVFDAEGRLVRANPATLETYGIDPVGAGAQEFVRKAAIRRPNREPITREKLPGIRALREGKVVSDLLVTTDVHGQERAGQVKAAPLVVSGRVVGSVGVWHDITERERLLEEVQRRVAELDATITSIADGVVIYNARGEIVRMNQSAEQMLGYSEAEFKKPAEERAVLSGLETPEGEPFPPEGTPVARALRGETVQGTVMVAHIRAGRTIWLSDSAAPINSPEGGILGAVVTLADVTPLHEVQELKEALVGMVSHDLRSPLTSVLGQAQMMAVLLERTGQDGSLRRSAEAIVTGAERMNTMIQDLADMSRAESGQLDLKRAPWTCAPSCPT